MRRIELKRRRAFKQLIAIGGLACWGLTLGAGHAHAQQTLFWINTTDATRAEVEPFYEIADNWDLSVVPTAADSIVFDHKWILQRFVGF